jgi:hypothetical protein
MSTGELKGVAPPFTTLGIMSTYVSAATFHDIRHHVDNIMSTAELKGGAPPFTTPGMMKLLGLDVKDAT